VKSKYAGKCTCGQKFAVGAEVTFDFDTRKVVRCPMCIASAGPLVPSFPYVDPREAATRALARLTPEQLAVARGYRGGYARMLATAGSGKSSVVIALAARLLSEGVSAKRIMLTTFTAKAKDELRERATALMGSAGAQIQINTFHSLARRWLLQWSRSMDPTLGRVDRMLDKGRGGGDQEDDRTARPRSPNALARILLAPKAFPIPWLDRPGLGDTEQPTSQEVDDYLNAVGFLQSYLIGPEDVQTEPYGRSQGLYRLPEFYRLWLDSLVALDVSTYDEWLYLSGRMALDPACAFGRVVGAQYDWVVVDEAQDNCLAQLVLADQAARNGPGNLLLVGDTSQSVYAFRGAVPSFMGPNLQTFAQRPVATYYLSTNFRSAARIVELSNALIEDAPWREGPLAVAHRPAVVNSVVRREYLTEAASAHGAASEAARVLEGAAVPRPVAVLGRTYARLALVEAELILKRTPYVATTGKGFFARWEIRVALAYMQLLHRMDVSPATVKEALGVPRRKLGEGFARDVVDRMQGGRVSAAAAVGAVIRTNHSWFSLGEGFRKDLERLGAIKDLGEQAKALAEMLSAAFKRPGKPSPSDDDRQENLEAFAVILATYGDVASLTEFARVALGRGIKHAEDNTLPVVTISTVHGYKGLQAPTVILMDCNEGSFPHTKAITPADLLEERRIEYVAVTRPQDRLVMVRAKFNRANAPTEASKAWFIAAELDGVKLLRRAEQTALNAKRTAAAELEEAPPMDDDEVEAINAALEAARQEDRRSRGHEMEIILTPSQERAELERTRAKLKALGARHPLALAEKATSTPRGGNSAPTTDLKEQ
jgi:DNA helicase-2/ATP-dependent DNA helicase PcrA